MEASRQVLGELALLWALVAKDKVEIYEIRVLEPGSGDIVHSPPHPLRGDAPVDSPRGAQYGYYRALGSNVARPAYSPEASAPMVRLATVLSSAPAAGDRVLCLRYLDCPGVFGSGAVHRAF